MQAADISLSIYKHLEAAWILKIFYCIYIISIKQKGTLSKKWTLTNKWNNQLQNKDILLSQYFFKI